MLWNVIQVPCLHNLHIFVVNVHNVLSTQISSFHLLLPIQVWLRCYVCPLDSMCMISCVYSSTYFISKLTTLLNSQKDDAIGGKELDQEYVHDQQHWVAIQNISTYPLTLSWPPISALWNAVSCMCSTRNNGYWFLIL